MEKVITCEYSRSIINTTYFQLLFSNHFSNLIKQRMNIKSLQQSAFPMISKWYKQNMKVEIFYVLYPHVSVIISKSTLGFNFTKTMFIFVHVLFIVYQCSLQIPSFTHKLIIIMWIILKKGSSCPCQSRINIRKKYLKVRR